MFQLSLTLLKTHHPTLWAGLKTCNRPTDRDSLPSSRSLIGVLSQSFVQLLDRFVLQRFEELLLVYCHRFIVPQNAAEIHFPQKCKNVSEDGMI